MLTFVRFFDLKMLLKMKHFKGIFDNYFKFNIFNLKQFSKMKKVIIAFFVLSFAATTVGFAQGAAAPTPTKAETASADFFAAKWNIVFIATPNGDRNSILTIERKEGKLTGYLTRVDKPDGDRNPLTNVEEEKDKIIIYFTAEGYDLSADLSKVDDDNLKGTLFNMFETKATRIK